MPFKLSEFLERFMTDAFVVTLTQLEKTGSTGKVLNPMEILTLNCALKLEVVHEISHHLHVRIWRVLFTSLSADEFQLNSKSAYISKRITILRLFPEKSHKDLLESSLCLLLFGN